MKFPKKGDESYLDRVLHNRLLLNLVLADWDKKEVPVFFFEAFMQSSFAVNFYSRKEGEKEGS